MNKPLKQGVVLAVLGFIASSIWLVFATFVPMLFTGQESDNTPFVAALYMALPIIALSVAVLSLIAGIKQHDVGLKLCSLATLLVWLPLLAALIA